MTPASIIATIVYVALTVFFVLMWARLGWFGPFLFPAAPDPPIKLVRRVVPPLRVGGAALDFAWSIVMLVVIILISVALGFVN